MPLASRLFRIFISSTFSDLKAERDALQARVFPRLQALCLAHGARFQAVDLRWGVSEEAGRDQQTMAICLGEIERCQQVTPRPNFLILLGDRYGWRPLPETIPADEYERIRGQVTEPAKLLLLENWYCQDENSVPPRYALQPRQGEFEDASAWIKIERQLAAILREAVARLDSPAPDRTRYGASATEQEIQLGVWGGSGDPERTFACVRHIEGLPDDPAASRYRDLDGEARPDLQAAQMLAGLKGRLFSKLPGRIYAYQAAWSGEGLTTDHIEQLCQDVYQSLSAAILSVLSQEENGGTRDLQSSARGRRADPSEEQAHYQFAQQVSRFFTGRQDLLASIASYLQSPKHRPIVIYGPSGSGKSALLAQAFKQARERTPGSILARFIGVTASSTNIRSLLEDLCRQVSSLYGAGQDEMPSSYNEIIKAFGQCLALASAERPLVIFIDALDQLGGAFDPANLAWLPTSLPEGVHLILSSLPGDYLTRLQRLLPEESFHKVPLMQPQEGDALLTAWLADAGRTLRPAQRQDILENFKVNGLPLYLRLAFEEARRWKSYDGLPLGADDVPGLAADIPGLLRDLFYRLSLEANHGSVLLSRSLGYLAAAKNGLTEDELIDILSGDPDVMEDFRRRSPFSPSVDRLPPVLWSRLYFDLEPYLASRSADGVTTLGFFHRQVSQVVNQDYLNGQDHIRRARSLAQYFEKQPVENHSGDRSSYNLRKLSELPYAQTHGEDWKGLEGTLGDLTFVAAKCAAGLTYELVDDYEVALKRLPEARKLTADRIRAFARFVNGQSHLLAQFPGSTEFGIQQAHLSARTTPVIQAADELIRASGMGAPMLIYRPWSRPHLDPSPSIIRTMDSWCSADGGFIAMTPDGKMAVSNNEPGFRIWDVSNGRLIRAVDEDQGWVGSVAISADGRLAVTGNGDQSVRLWDTATGRCVKILTGHTDRPGAVCLTPDGGVAASGGSSDDPILRVWDLHQGRCLRTFPGHPLGVTALALTADGSRLVSAGNDQLVCIWDLTAGHLWKTLRWHTQPVRSIAMTPDGKRLVTTAGEDEKTILWDLETGRRLRTLGKGKDAANSVAITPDGRLIIGGLDDGSLIVWDGRSGEILDRKVSQAGSIGAIEQVAVTEDGRMALSGSWNGILNVWDLATGHPEPTFDGVNLNDSLVSVAFTADGRRALAAGKEEGLIFFDTSTGVGTIIRRGGPKSGWITKAAFSSDGQRVLTARGDGTIGLYGARGRRLDHIPAHHGYGSTIAASPDGRFALTGGEDKEIFLWDVVTRQNLRKLSGHADVIEDVAFAPDGVLALSSSSQNFDASGKNNIFLWNLASGKRILILRKLDWSINCVTFTPDGRRAIAGGINNRIGIWDVPSGQNLHILEGHTDEVTCLAVSADGSKLISGSRDKTVRVWDIESGRCLNISGLPFVITSLAIHGDYLMVAGQTGNILHFKFYDPKAGPGIVTAAYRYTYEKMAWDLVPHAICPWCGWRFEVPQDILAAIDRSGRRLKPAQSPCHRLPSEAFAQPILRMDCPGQSCQKSLRFNPFLVDQRAGSSEKTT